MILNLFIKSFKLIRDFLNNIVICKTERRFWYIIPRATRGGSNVSSFRGFISS